MKKFERDLSYYENLYEQKMIRNQKSYYHKFNNSNDNNQKMALNLLWYFTKMSDYNNREKTIEKWIENDRKRDLLYENTAPFHDRVRCKLCNHEMIIEDKDFWHWIDKKPDRILFLYRCEKCHIWRAFFNTWEELEPTSEYCSKCWDIIKYNSKFNWNILIKTYSCKSCWNKYTKQEDFSIWGLKEDPITKEDIELHWYNSKEALKMKESHASISELKTIMDDIDNKWEQEKYTEEYHKLKKYNIFQLEQFISKKLLKTDYKDFKIISKNNIKTYVKCEFEVYYTWPFWDNSSKELDKLITKLVSNSNWKLQKYKTSEKLWAINWFLLWYDNKDDLIKLIKSRK